MPRGVVRRLGDCPVARLLGLGWIDAGAYGCGRSGLRVAFGERATHHDIARQDGLFSKLPQNFRRFAPEAKLVCGACALALGDAGLHGLDDRDNPDIGLLYSNNAGCDRANREYFADFVGCGRKLGRGAFFVFTLPSSPLAGASIHYRLRGPVAYFGFPQRPLPRLIELAADMLAGAEASRMLVTAGDERRAVCCLLDPGGEGGGEEDVMDLILRFADNAPELGAILRVFAG